MTLRSHCYPLLRPSPVTPPRAVDWQSKERSDNGICTMHFEEDTHLLFEHFHSHLQIILVKPTFCLFRSPGPTSRALALLAFAGLLRAVPIANAFVSLIEKRVPRDVVLRDVRLDRGEVPGEERVEFEEACGVDFEWR